MIQALIDECDGLIVLSLASAESLRATYGIGSRTQIAIIPHGHYAGVYPNEISRADARSRLQLSTDARVVLSLGRLQPYKGLEELIAAFADVAASHDVLLLAGGITSESYRDELERAVTTARLDASRVRILDAVVPDAELQIYFNACDLVALPFRRVLNSGSLLLAMSFGCPVVAPRLGSIPEVACPEGWFPYDPADANGLSEALRDALDCTDLARRRARVLEFTLATYDWYNVGRKASELYESIIERGPARQL
jgi:glycosyltransferase involved in cell wall biosynthesis